MSGELQSGLNFHRSGDLRQAERSYRKVLEQDPCNPEAHHLLGVVALQSKQFQKAVDSIQKAIEYWPQGVQYFNSLGLAFWQMKKPGEAVAAFGRAIEIRPDFLEANYNLGNILHSLEKFEQAATPVTRAVSLAPQDFTVHFLLGNQLNGLKELDRAAASYRRAIEINRKFYDGHIALATVLQRLGKLDESAVSFQHAIEINPRNPKPHYRLSLILIEAGRPAEAARVCDRGLAVAHYKSRLLAAKAAALADAGDPEVASSLLDYDRILAPTKIQAPPSFSGVAEFNDALEPCVLTHPTLGKGPSGNATRHGQHTDELLVEPSEPIAALERIIREAVGRYSAQVERDPTHPLAGWQPKDWRLTAWAVVMARQGHQLPHTHPRGWLSGVYYARIPESVRAEDSDHAGWIEFGRPGPSFKCHSESPLRLVRPEEGLMVLFPSYLYHRTIPYHSEETRISIAFDVIPTNEAITENW